MPERQNKNVTQQNTQRSKVTRGQTAHTWCFLRGLCILIYKSIHPPIYSFQYNKRQTNRNKQIKKSWSRNQTIYTLLGTTLHFTFSKPQSVLLLTDWLMMILPSLPSPFLTQHSLNLISCCHFSMLSINEPTICNFTPKNTLPTLLPKVLLQLYFQNYSLKISLQSISSTTKPRVSDFTTILNHGSIKENSFMDNIWKLQKFYSFCIILCVNFEGCW